VHATPERTQEHLIGSGNKNQVFLTHATLEEKKYYPNNPKLLNKQNKKINHIIFTEAKLKIFKGKLNKTYRK
jgi:hypothetical protein